MWKNCPDTTVVLNSVSEAWRHPAERSSRYPKLHSHILMQREVLFRCKQHDRLFLHWRLPRTLCLGTGTQPHHYFLWVLSSLLNATLFVSVSTIDCLTLDRSENYRHHRCQNTSHLKRGFSLCPLFGNLFEPICKFFPLDLWSSESESSIIFL